MVLDTCVLVAALRSPTGASALLVEGALRGKFKPLISVPLVFEYEAILTRPEHLETSQFTEDEVVRIIKAICRNGEPVHLVGRLRPQLRDPDDEFVLETAVHGKAEAIVTFNCRDFWLAAQRFGIEIITPRDALRRMGPA